MSGPEFKLHKTTANSKHGETLGGAIYNPAVLNDGFASYEASAYQADEVVDDIK